jgi:hypothetical protein
MGDLKTLVSLSQQLIIAEGRFKSKLDTSFANQWMTTVNASYNWNWMRMYGDAGFLKNKTARSSLFMTAG